MLGLRERFKLKVWLHIYLFINFDSNNIHAKNNSLNKYVKMH